MDSGFLERMNTLLANGEVPGKSSFTIGPGTYREKRQGKGGWDLNGDWMGANFEMHFLMLSIFTSRFPSHDTDSDNPIQSMHHFLTWKLWILFTSSTNLPFWLTSMSQISICLGLFEGDEHTTLMTQCKEGAQREGHMLDTNEELYKWFTHQVIQF